MGIFGAALIAVIVFSPSGIAGGLQVLWGRITAGHDPTASAKAAATSIGNPPPAERLDYGPPA